MTDALAGLEPADEDDAAHSPELTVAGDESVSIPAVPESVSRAVLEPVETDGMTVESIVRLLTLARADLADALDEDAPPEQLLDHVVQVAVRMVPGTDDAGIALVSDTGLETVAAAGDVAVAADDVQRAIGAGPADAVIAEGSVLRIADLAADERWDQFGAMAADLGVRALLACPLPMPRQRAGVLTLYSARVGAFDAAAELVVPVFAARAAIAAAYAEKVTHLERAVRSRQVIGQAVGILMERHRLSAKQAFATLVTASQESHLKLREVAQRVTETGEEPSTAAQHR
jgi:transcriptional regulator with GAF, ATPase, and Fis domain